MTEQQKATTVDPIKWAEGLILQLPESHDGRNSWLLNHGASPEADEQRAAWNSRAIVDYLHYHRAFKTPFEIAMMRVAAPVAQEVSEAIVRTACAAYSIALARTGSRPSAFNTPHEIAMKAALRAIATKPAGASAASR